MERASLDDLLTCSASFRRLANILGGKTLPHLLGVKRLSWRAALERQACLDTSSLSTLRASSSRARVRVRATRREFEDQLRRAAEYHLSHKEPLARAGPASRERHDRRRAELAEDVCSETCPLPPRSDRSCPTGEPNASEGCGPGLAELGRRVARRRRGPLSCHGSARARGLGTMMMIRRLARCESVLLHGHRHAAFCRSPSRR